MNGKKTKTAAALLAALAISHALAAYGLPHIPTGMEQSLVDIASALGLFGVAHKLDKLAK